MVVRVSLRDSWYLPLARLDPRVGRIDRLWPDIAADMFGASSADGGVAALAFFTDASLWRFTRVIDGTR